MDEKTLIAFRMKFQSRSYQEISQATGFTELTIRSYFSREGNWRKAYDEWATKEAELVQTEARQAFQGAITMGVEIMVAALERQNIFIAALREKISDLVQSEQMKEVPVLIADLERAEDRAMEIARQIMDRAGMSVVSRVRDETPLPPSGAQDDVIQRLRDSGIDPDSIRFISPAPAKTEGSLPE